MARPSQIAARRRELIPIVARAFAELGYRRTTTAELAGRCGVRENILYRLWPDKKAMFIAAIGHVYESSVAIWSRLLAEPAAAESAAERVLEYESRHHGEFGQYRLVFAGLNETDDPEIRAALAQMYAKYQRFVRDQMAAHRARPGRSSPPDSRAAAGLPAELAAWAVVGLGTVANIARELDLLGDAERQKLIRSAGRLLLESGPR